MTDSQKWLVLILSVLFAGLLFVLAPVLTPFLTSALLAYLGDPIVDRLERSGLGRTAGVTLVFVIMVVAATVVLFVLVPLVQRQFIALLSALPQAIAWLQSSVAPVISESLGIELVEVDVAAGDDDPGTLVAEAPCVLADGGDSDRR